jgi:hypothetical protein
VTHVRNAYFFGARVLPDGHRLRPHLPEAGQEKANDKICPGWSRLVPDRPALSHIRFFWEEAGQSSAGRACTHDGRNEDILTTDLPRRARARRVDNDSHVLNNEVKMKLGCQSGQVKEAGRGMGEVFSSGAGFYRCKSLISHLASYKKTIVCVQLVYDKVITV